MRIESVAQKIAISGYDKLEKIGDIPAILCKGYITSTSGFTHYKINAYWRSQYEKPNINRLIGKSFEILSWFKLIDIEKRYYPKNKETYTIIDSIANTINLNWIEKVKAVSKFKTISLPMFIVRVKDRNSFCMWHYKEGKPEEDYTPFKLETCIITMDSNFDYGDILNLKKIAENIDISILDTIYKKPHLFLDNLIETILINKNENEKPALKEKVWLTLENKGFFTDNEIKGNLSDIIKAIRQAIRKPYKPKKISIRHCKWCGKEIQSRHYCTYCAKKKKFAEYLIEYKDRINKPISKFTNKDKQAFLDEYRPKNLRYSFDYFKNCLTEYKRKEG